jgi:hypothetical protein
VSESGSDHPRPLDPEKLISTLADHEVKYVLVGALAARLQGFPRLTAVADITPATDHENLERLTRALRTLEARVFTEGVPEGLDFDCSPQTISRAEMWKLVTEAGRLDIIFRPAGTEGYQDLARDVVAYSVFGVGIVAASLEDLIRTKEAAGRPQDRQDVVILREMVRGKETG